MSKEALYGFFSWKHMELKQEMWHNSKIPVYETPDGLEVEVTDVSTDPNGLDIPWTDKKCVGPLAKLATFHSVHPPGREF